MAVTGADGKEIPVAVGATIDNYIEAPKDLAINEIKVAKLGDTVEEVMKKLPTSLKKNLQKIPDGRVKKGYKYFLPMRNPRTLGSAGLFADSALRNEQRKIIPLDVLRIRMMVDPYNFSNRTLFTDAAFQDPTLAQALQKRNNAFYSNDFYLDFELKSMTNPLTGDPYTPDEANFVLAGQKQEFLKYLFQLEAWRKDPNIECLQKMKRCHISNLVQGRSLTLIVPKPSDLGVGELPLSLRVITWENTGQVYVDTIYWQIIGVRLFFINKDMASPDEMIYITYKNWGLRWLSDFYGASELESLVQISRINRKLLNYHLAKAIENSITNKIILQSDVQGDQPTRQKQIQSLVNNLLSQGMDIAGLEYRTTVTPVAINVDAPMVEMVADLLDDRLISGAGATRAQMGRTENLNRDTATIMEVENIRNIRTPDEELVSTAYETQLFNPLLAHLANKPFEEIPVRIVIKRIEPTDEAVDPNLEKKLAEIKGASEKPGSGAGLVQQDAGGQGIAGTKSFGASGSMTSLIVSLENHYTLMKVTRNEIVRNLVRSFSWILPKTFGASAENAASKENDDDATVSEEATLDDVKAWSSKPNSRMLYHYINPNNWEDRDDYTYIAKNARNWDKLNKEQQIVVIRAFYFRNPGQNVKNILNDYGFKTPRGESAFCWTVMMPSMKEHVIAPIPADWSHTMVLKSYDELDDNEKHLADLVYTWRHTPHDAKHLKKLEQIPEYPEEQ